jgi:hypothetical protein
MIRYFYPANIQNFRIELKTLAIGCFGTKVPTLAVTELKLLLWLLAFGPMARSKRIEPIANS